MPSARWIGYWEQDTFGRQPMSDLQLEFDGGKITGSGWDIVGPFKFSGECGTGGAVALVKQYLGQHAVLYEGWYDGEGTISGQWIIRVDTSGLNIGELLTCIDEHDQSWTLRGRFQMRLARAEGISREIEEFDAQPLP
jgi:hypothetical protein